MNRTRLGVLSLVFLVSAVLGLATAHSLTTLLDMPIASAENADAPAQRNVVIIHVDDLEAKNPQLISVWSSFSVVNEQTYITMAPLYPGAVPDPAYASLIETFDLNSRKKPAKEFLEALEAFQIEWSGYVLVDNLGMQDMHKWVAGVDSAAFLQDETMLLNGICQGLNAVGNSPDEYPEWNAIYPAHLTTDLSMQRVMAYWQGVIEADSPVVCNVFTD